MLQKFDTNYLKKRLASSGVDKQTKEAIKHFSDRGVEKDAKSMNNQPSPVSKLLFYFSHLLTLILFASATPQ